MGGLPLMASAVPPKADGDAQMCRCNGINGLRRVFKGVPYGPRRATKSDEDASGRPNRINGLRRVFKGVPYGPRRATKSDEDASGRPNRINGLRRVFKGVPYGLRATKGNADAQCADAIESMACGASSRECPMARGGPPKAKDASS